MKLPESKTLTLHQKGDVVYYSFPHIDAYPCFKTGFSTRLGGVSEGIYASMNLSYTRGDAKENVDENFRFICDAMGVSADNVVISAQEHHTNLQRVTTADMGKGKTFTGFADIDGLLTNDTNVVLSTQYADCVPLLFADPVKKAVAASHAGWRGTVAEIGRLTVERMGQEFGSKPQDILVGIAPSIGKCCFEVDTPVLEAFEQMAVFDKDCYTEEGNGKHRIDLWEVNRRVLIQSGVKAENITVTDLCTKCHSDVFWSHRVTGGDRGSLAAFISIIK